MRGGPYGTLQRLHPLFVIFSHTVCLFLLFTSVVRAPPGFLLSHSCMLVLYIFVVVVKSQHDRVVFQCSLSSTFDIVSLSVRRHLGNGGGSRLALLPMHRGHTSGIHRGVEEQPLRQCVREHCRRWRRWMDVAGHANDTNSCAHSRPSALPPHLGVVLRPLASPRRSHDSSRVHCSHWCRRHHHHHHHHRRRHHRAPACLAGILDCSCPVSSSSGQSSGHCRTRHRPRIAAPM